MRTALIGVVALAVAAGGATRATTEHHPVVRATSQPVAVAGTDEVLELRAAIRVSRDHVRHALARQRRHHLAAERRAAIKARRRAQLARRAAAAAAPAGAAGWAQAPFAVRVANCESGGGASDHSATYDGNPHLRDGLYHGKWQMDSAFWASYGGLRFAADAADATEAQQDYVAWRGWRARGWQPWQCATLV